MAAMRPHSAPSSTYTGSTSRIRKDAEQLYLREELPNVYIDDKKRTSNTTDQVSSTSTLEGQSRSNVVDWESEDDAANPRNFPFRKKTINIACLFFMSVVSPFTSSVIAPAIPNIMTDFSSTNAYLSAFVLSIYVLGYAFGPLLISPLSEQYGRLPLYHFCNLLFTICTALCGRANDLGTLAILRFLAGVGGSSVFALVPSSLADIMATDKRGSAMALIGLAYNLGPAISPTAGSYLNAATGWRWVFYLTGILGAVGTVSSILCMSETYEPVLLRRKATRLRKSTGNTALKARTDMENGGRKLKVFKEAMLMPFRMLLFSRPVFFTSLLTAIGYGYLYILYTTLPTTFLNTYHWKPKTIGLAYLGIGVGNVVGGVAGGMLSDRIVKARAAKGDTRPENRLLPMIFSWPMVSVGLLVYAWTAEEGVHWVVPLIGTAVFGAGALTAIFFTGTYILDAYPLHSASGMAACAVLRSLIGGLAPLFSHKMYQKLGVGWMFSLLAFIALAFAPVPWVFYRFGKRWRARERYGGQAENAAGNEDVRAEAEGTGNILKSVRRSR